MPDTTVETTFRLKLFSKVRNKTALKKVLQYRPRMEEKHKRQEERVKK